MNKSPGFRDLLDVLKPLVDFTSDTLLMRKMQGGICAGDNESAKCFATKAAIHIDWRWESMCKALDVQVPIHSKLKDTFDEQKLLTSESSKSILSSS